jgi:Na+/H+-dicarboxylate symporter
MSETLLHPIRHLGDQIEAWIRTRLWAQVVAGLVLGILVGYLLGPDVGWVTPETSERVGKWLALPGNLFLGLISMVLIPLVVGSIVQGLNGPQSAEELRSVGFRFLVYVLLTTTAAAALGIALANEVRPGDFLATEAAASSSAPAPEPLVVDAAEVSVPDAIVDMLPTNPVVAMQELDMLALVVLALIFGLACRASPHARVGILLDVVDGLVAVAMKVVKWAMFLTPFAVFGLTAQLIARVGIATLLGMAAYVLSVVAGLLGLLTLYLVIVSTLGRRNPFRFLASVADPLVLAFSTSSSAAVMPLSIDTAVKKLGVPESTASLVIPLGATVNMAGTALYQSVAIVFMAQVAGIELSLAQQTAIVVTLVASSIGAPGTPGVGIVILGNVAASFGVPATALPLVLGVDRILDMCRTAVNLAGDLVACVLLSPAGTRRE